MLIPARIRCHRRKGIGRAGRRSVRPDPARTGSRLVRVGPRIRAWSWPGPRPRPPRYAAPPPRALTRLVVRAPGGRPVAAPGLRSGMFLPAEVTRGAVITGEFRALAPGHRRPAAHGRPRTAMPRFRCRRRHHRGDAAEPGGNPSSTGHVWITIWRRYGRDPFRIFSPPSLPTASVLVTGGGAARVSPGTSAGTIRRICTVHRRVLCTAPYTRDLAGAGVIGACSHAGPGCPAARVRGEGQPWWLT